MDVVEVMETLVEEIKTQIPISQVVRELKNQRFSSITIKSMDIMHMSEKRDNIIKTSKDKINQTTQIAKPILCLWRVLKQWL
jgi:ubiquinone biosynthesis protein COQ9